MNANEQVIETRSEEARQILVVDGIEELREVHVAAQGIGNPAVPQGTHSAVEPQCVVMELHQVLLLTELKDVHTPDKDKATGHSTVRDKCRNSVEPPRKTPGTSTSAAKAEGQKSLPCFFLSVPYNLTLTLAAVWVDLSFAVRLKWLQLGIREQLTKLHVQKAKVLGLNQVTILLTERHKDPKSHFS